MTKNMILSVSTGFILTIITVGCGVQKAESEEALTDDSEDEQVQAPALVDSEHGSIRTEDQTPAELEWDDTSYNPGVTIAQPSISLPSNAFSALPETSIETPDDSSSDSESHQNAAPGEAVEKHIITLEAALKGQTHYGKKQEACRKSLERSIANVKGRCAHRHGRVLSVKEYSCSCSGKKTMTCKAPASAQCEVPN